MSEHGGGWIGVDLDGTLAHYSGWVHHTHIGEPIPLMVERVKRWLDQGVEVRIMTARADASRQTFGVYCETLEAIRTWCLKHIGATLPITREKDFAMIELWDDRAVQVVPNTGLRADEWCPCGHPGR